MFHSNYMLSVLLSIVCILPCFAEVIEIRSEREFNEHLQKGKATVIKFFATWCGPCKQLKPKYEELAGKDKYSDVIFLAVDVDKHEGLTDKYGIRGMPTTIFLDANGKEVKRTAGGDGFIQEASMIIDTKLLKQPAEKVEKPITQPKKKKITKARPKQPKPAPQRNTRTRKCPNC